MNRNAIFWLLVAALSAAAMMVVNLYLIAMNASNQLRITHYLWLLPPALLIVFSVIKVTRDHRKVIA